MITSDTPPEQHTTLPDEPDPPLVSVGMPVYNGSNTIRDAISAIQRQTFHDFELIISDNASTDETLRWCEAAASSDPRIRILRQEKNLGPVANFGAVLQAARGRYFMFAAADDHVEPQFIDEAMAALLADPAAVACAPRTLVHYDHKESREAIGTAPIVGPNWLRPGRFLMRPADNSRFYGLYHIEVMRAAYLKNTEFWAFDWAVSALTLTKGSHVRSASILLHRRGSPLRKYHLHHRKHSSGWMETLFPIARMSMTLIPRLRISQIPFALVALLILNAEQCAEHLFTFASDAFRK